MTKHLKLVTSKEQRFILAPTSGGWEVRGHSFSTCPAFVKASCHLNVQQKAEEQTGTDGRDRPQEAAASLTIAPEVTNLVAGESIQLPKKGINPTK